MQSLRPLRRPHLPLVLAVRLGGVRDPSQKDTTPELDDLPLLSEPAATVQPMQELATFLAGIVAVVAPVAALMSEGRRRHRAAINETLALAETFRHRDAAIATRFDRRAVQLAVEYLDDVEQEPRTYPKVVTAVALVIAVGATVVVGVGSVNRDEITPTASAAGGLIAGVIALGVRPMIGDAWARLAHWTEPLRRRLGLP